MFLKSVCTLLQSMTVNYLTFAQNYIWEIMCVIKSVRNIYAREARDIINVIKYHLLHKIRLC